MHVLRERGVLDVVQCVRKVETSLDYEVGRWGEGGLVDLCKCKREEEAVSHQKDRPILIQMSPLFLADSCGVCLC